MMFFKKPVHHIIIQLIFGIVLHMMCSKYGNTMIECSNFQNIKSNFSRCKFQLQDILMCEVNLYSFDFKALYTKTQFSSKCLGFGVFFIINIIKLLNIYIVKPLKTRYLREQIKCLVL